MDLKSMNRKELQALCKKHEIPANTSNSQMIESLSSILQEKVKPKGCLKGSGGSSAEDLGVFQGGSKKVTFVVEDGEEDGNEGFVVNPVGRSKRKSVGRGSGVAAKFENSSGSESPKNAIEVPQRTTRSRGLAEAVLWSPVIVKKKMKKSVDGTEGVRENAKEKKGISVAVPTTRSLRNRVVTVGGDEEVVTDQNLRRTRKTKDSVKEEENEKVAALEEDKAVGRRNFRKRSRDAESVEDEPPRRRSTRSHVMLEEAETVEEVDVGRSRKRRKGDLEILVVEKVVEKVADAEAERVSKSGGNAKRLRGNASGDANDSEVVATSTRRSTRSSSGLIEDGKFATAVGKSDREGDAVRKGNSQKQANARVSKGGDSVNLLTDSEVLAEPVRRSTRSSSTIPEYGTSLPAVVKSVKGGVAVRKGKSLKQAKDNSSKGGNTTSSLPDSEAIAMPIRRSARSSSSLLENGTSIPGVGKSVEEGEVVTTPTRKSTRSSSKRLEDEKPNEAVNTPTRRRSTQSSSKLLEVEMPNNEVVNSPTKRSTRGSSKLLDDEMPNYEAVNSPTKRSTRSSSKLLEVKMPDNEAFISPMRKLTRSSSKLMEDEMPDNEVVTSSTRKSTRSSSKLLEIEMPKNEAVTSHTKRATRSSSKLFEEEMPSNEAVSKPTRRLPLSSSKQGDSTAPLQYSEAVTPARRLARSSSKSVADVIPNKEAVTASTRRSTHSSLKLLEDEILDNGSLATPTRRSTCSPSKMLAAETSLPAVCKLDVQNDAIRSDDSGKQPKDHTSKQVDSTVSLSNNDAVITPTRRSARSVSDIQGNVSGEPMCSYIDVTVDAEGPLELYGDVISKVSAPVELTSPTVKPSSGGTSVGALDDVVGIASMVSQNITPTPLPLKSSGDLSKTFHTEISTVAQLKEPDSAVEVVEREDMVTGYEEAHTSSPQFPCKSSAELSLTFDTEASLGIHLEGPNSQAEIHDYTEDALEGNEAADIREPTFVCKSSELLSPSFNSEASPVTDLKEPVSLVEVEGSSEDVSKIIDPMTSDIEVCPNAEEFDAKVEVHITSKGGMEGTDDKNTAGLPLSCKSTGVLMPTLLNEVSPDINLGESVLKVGSHDMSKVASHPNDFFVEASDNHSKTLKVSMTADWDALYLSDIQRMFDNETENCTTDQDSALNAQSAPGECNVGKKVESLPGNSDSLSCEVGLEFVKETWVSSTLSVTVNEGIGTEENKSDAETNGDEGRPSSSSENPAFDLCSGDLMKEHGTQSSEEIVDQATALCSLGNAKQSDFTQSLCDEDLAGVDGNMRDPFDDKFCEGNNDHFLSPDAFVKFEDNESSHNKIGVVSSDIREENLNVEHGSFIHSLASGSKSVKQMEKEDRLHDADLKSTKFSASANDNRSPISLGYEGSTKQEGIQDFPCIPDSGDSRHLSNQQEVTVNVTESLDVDSADRSSKSTPKAHDTVKPLNVVADILSETANTANEHTDMESEQVHELCVVVAEETENLEFLESNASIVGGDDIVMKKADGVGQDKFDHVEVGRQQDEAHLLQETKALSGEHHTDDIASHPSLGNSDSGDSRHLSDQQEGMVNVIESLDVDSADRSPKSTPKAQDTVEPLNVVADILSETADTANEHTDTEFERIHELGVVVAEETENLEFLECDAGIEGGGDIVMKKADSIGQDKFDHVEVGRQQDEAHLLQESKALSGEHHTDDIASHPSLENSDSGDSRHLSDQQEVMVNVTESLDVDSADRSPKSTPKAHDTVEPLNVVAEILSETADAANEHTDMEFERIHELGVVVAEETENLEFLECDAGIEGGDDIVMKKADSIGQDKFDHVGVGRQQDEAHLLESKALSGEHHTDDIASHPSLENSDSGDSRHLSDQQEVMVIVTESLDVDSADRSPKSTPKAHDTVEPLNVVADILSETADTANEHTDTEFERIHEPGVVVAEETENLEFLECDAGIEGGDDIVMKKADSIGQDQPGRQQDEAHLLQESKALSGEHHTDDIASHLSLGNSASMSEETLLSLEKFDLSTHRENESNDEKEIGAKRESRLPCNIHEGLNAALGESNEEERAHVSPIKPENTPEATMIGEQHTAPSTSESTPPDTLNCIEAGLCKESSFGGANSVDIRGEDNDLKGVYSTNNDNVELKESSDLNTIIASSKTAEREHGVDHCINMSFCWMVQDSKDTGISENNEASPSASSSPKSHTQDEESNRYQGKLESFVQASSGEATWAAPGGTLMFVEELFHMDSKVASSVNDSAPVGQLGRHSENLAHGKCGNFSEEAVATQEGEMKTIAVSESSVAKIEEARPYECVMSSEIFSGGSAKPCTGMDSQATHSAEQSEGQEGRRVFSQENLEVSKDTMFALLDGKIEGSVKIEGSEITPLPRVANQELITKNFTELSVTNVTDQALWDRKEPMESRSVGNLLEDSKLRETVTAQHALVSLDAGAARHSSTAMQEGSVVGKDEIMAPEEYFEDFGWSFADTFDVDSSHQEVQAVDSQPPMESRIGNSADHSSKSGIDVNQEQSMSSEHDQIEESMECVQGTPMQLVRNFKPYSVIDDAIKNKENTVGLKMDSTRKHNDNSTISNSSRRPLQSVRRDKEEH